jgi:uncharacterized membrane protein
LNFAQRLLEPPDVGEIIVIEHLQNHSLGLVHLLTALAAMFFGAAVIFNRKGTRKHRWMGRSYVAMMLALNVTALLNYELYGQFGPFHWMVLASLATIVAGWVPTWRKAPGWIYRHAYFMAWSYIGLIAAAFAEVASRIPGWSFGPSVIISSVIVIVAGVWMMRNTVPHIINTLRAGSD